MSKNFKQSLGSVGAHLYEVMSAIVQTNDLAAAGQIETFKEIIALVLNAQKQGLEVEKVLALIAAFRRERLALASGEIEMAGAASTGFEDSNGHSLNLELTAGGTLAGIGLGFKGGYETHNQESSFERSSQNFRILARWAVGPDNLSEELTKALVEFIAKPTPGAAIPALPESFKSPTLEMIKDILPLLAKKLE